jgi:hypothetical protein
MHPLTQLPDVNMAGGLCRLLREIRSEHPELLELDFHVRRTHEGVLHGCRFRSELLDDALELATFMKQRNWLLSPSLIGVRSPSVLPLRSSGMPS